MTKEHFDKLFEWIREQYHKEKYRLRTLGRKPNGQELSTLWHRYVQRGVNVYLERVSDTEHTERQILDMIKDRFHRMNRKENVVRCKCGERAFKKWARTLVCWGCYVRNKAALQEAAAKARKENGTVKVSLEFSCGSSAFEDNVLGEIRQVLKQAANKCEVQLGREPCACTAPEWSDILRDSNGAKIGRLKVKN